MDKLDINEIREITEKQQAIRVKVEIGKLEKYITQYAEIGVPEYVHTTRRAYAKEIVEHFEKLGFTVVSNDTDGGSIIIKISWEEQHE